MKLVYLFEDISAKLSNLKNILLGKKSLWLRRKLKLPPVLHVKPDPNKPDQKAPDAPEITPEVEQAAVDEINDAVRWDPTTKREIDGMFMQFIVRNIANNSIRLPEDGPPLRDALETFIKASRKSNWTHKKDVMQFTDWRQLQRATMQWLEDNQDSSVPSSETEWIKKAKEGSDKIVEYDFIATGGKAPGSKHYLVMQINTPVAGTVYGKGSEWCTSASLFKTIKKNELDKHLDTLLGLLPYTYVAKNKHNPYTGMNRQGFVDLISKLNDGLSNSELKVPNPYLDSALTNAESFLRSGPMFVIFKNGKPYIQMTNDASDKKDVNDHELSIASPVLAAMFKKMIQSGKMSEKLTQSLRSHIDSSGLAQLEANGLTY